MGIPMLKECALFIIVFVYVLNSLSFWFVHILRLLDIFVFFNNLHYLPIYICTVVCFQNHQDEFNIDAALYELYKYVQHYYDDLSAALEEDEFARKNRLNHKLEQVQNAMSGDAY